MGDWNLAGTKYVNRMFTNSNCTVIECVECTSLPTISPTTSSFPSAGPSISPTTSTSTKEPTKEPTKLPTQTSKPTPSPTATPSPAVVSNCEKDHGKKFEYRGDKYSCKQLNRTKRKYRKRMCKRVKQAKKLCPVICKYKT